MRFAELSSFYAEANYSIIICDDPNRFLGITLAVLNLNRSRRHFANDRGSDGMLPWTLWALSVKGSQNNPEKNELLCQGDSASEMPILVNGKMGNR